MVTETPFVNGVTYMMIVSKGKIFTKEVESKKTTLTRQPLFFGDCRTTSDYSAMCSNELSYRQGDEVLIFSKIDEDVYYGFHYPSNKFGQILAKNVIITESMKKAEQQLQQETQKQSEQQQEESSVLKLK